MADKILCPWCGAEMEIKTVRHDVPGIIYARGAKKREQRWNAWTSCTNDDCGADGPIVAELESEQEAIDAARTAAFHRYTPLKPMPLEKAYGRTVNIELKDGGRMRRIALSVAARRARAIEIFVPWNISHEAAIVLPKDNYGKTWRCWSRKPTDEERSAAEWEN